MDSMNMEWVAVVAGPSSEARERVVLVNSDKCEGGVSWVLQATGRQNGVVSYLTTNFYTWRWFFLWLLFSVMCCFISFFAARHSLRDFRIPNLWRDGFVWEKPLRPTREAVVSVRDEFISSTECLSPWFWVNEHMQTHLTFLWVLSH